MSGRQFLFTVVSAFWVIAVGVLTILLGSAATWFGLVVMVAGAVNLVLGFLAYRKGR